MATINNPDPDATIRMPIDNPPPQTESPKQGRLRTLATQIGKLFSPSASRSSEVIPANSRDLRGTRIQSPSAFIQQIKTSIRSRLENRKELAEIRENTQFGISNITLKMEENLPREKPDTLLKMFRECFRSKEYQGVTDLRIRFHRVPAIDHGALSKQAIAQLFGAIAEGKGSLKTTTFSGTNLSIFKPADPERGLSKAEKKLYQTFGELIRFVDRNGQLLTGQIFPNGMYSLVEAMSCEMESSKSDQDILEGALNGDIGKSLVFGDLDEGDLNLLSRFDHLPKTPPNERDAAIELLYYAVPDLNELPEDPVAHVKKYWDGLQQKIEKQKMELPVFKKIAERTQQLKESLPCLLEVARGMSQSKIKPSEVTTKAIGVRVQGNPFKLEDLGKVFNLSACPYPKRPWFTNWLKNQNPEVLHAFFMFATGSPVPREGSVITITKPHVASTPLWRGGYNFEVPENQESHPVLQAHACINELIIPFDSFKTEKEFGDFMSAQMAPELARGADFNDM